MAEPGQHGGGEAGPEQRATASSVLLLLSIQDNMQRRWPAQCPLMTGAYFVVLAIVLLTKNRTCCLKLQISACS